MSQARVFLIETVRRDFNLESLKEFGIVTYLYNSDERRGSLFRTEEFCQEVKARLLREQFDSEGDYFCLTGGLVPTSLALSVLSRMFPTLNLLLYNTGDDSYVCRVVNYDTESEAAEGFAEAV